MFYLVSTPIGNLSDITYRAVEALKSCDLILCEDTRHSLTLLKHYDIHKPLRSYHQYNEKESVDKITEELQNGKTICLISDAGTPLISDPGYPLIQGCIEKGIPLTPLPGPSACINALVGSGLPSHRFQYVGFLPQKKSDLAKALTEMLLYPGTSICYESPHRLLETLQSFAVLDGCRNGCVAREMTKKFETFHRGSLQELAHFFDATPPKGEIVLLIEGCGTFFTKLHADPLAYAKELEEQFRIPKKEAIKIAAELCDVKKRDLYKNSIA